MRLSIKREGKGWTNAAVHRFHWAKLTRDFAEHEGPTMQDALKEKAPKRPAWDHPARGVHGMLASLIHHKHATRGETLRMEWLTLAHYARWVVHGTRRHGIDPVKKRWLHWVDNKGEHFARHTNHPGAKSNPFPSKVLAERRGQVIRSFGRAVRDNVKE